MKRRRAPSRAVAVVTLGLSLACLSLPAVADEPAPTATTTPSEQPTPTPEPPPEPTPTPEPPPPAPTPDPPPAPTPEPPPSPEPTPEPPPSPEPSPEPPPSPSPEPTPGPTPTPDPGPEPTPSPDPAPSSPDPAPAPAPPSAPAPGAADRRVVLPPTVSTSGALVDADGSGGIDAGDRLEVTFTVTNPSSLPMSDISLSASGDVSISCPATALAPGASMTCVGRVRVDQADVDAGSASFPGVTARGVVSDDKVSAGVPGVTVGIAARPGLSAGQRVSQARDRNQDGRVGRGDGLVFRLDVVNTGNVTISNLSVEDALLSRWNQAMSCPVTRLAPGARTTCSSDVFNVTVGMVEDGSLTNAAVAVGTTPKGQQVRSAKTITTTALTRSTATSPDTPDDVKPVRKLHLSQYLGKFDDVNGNGALTEGETLNFGFRVTNKGTVALNRLTIVSPRLEELGVRVTCGRASLEPGAATSCASAPVRVNQNMGRIGHGFGTNHAHAVAFDAASVSVRSNSTQVTQGYFANELQQGGALATTGADVNGILLGGGLAVLLGGVAIGIGRRREDSAS